MRASARFKEWRFNRRTERRQRHAHRERMRRLQRMAALEEELRDLECMEVAARVFETGSAVEAHYGY